MNRPWPREIASLCGRALADWELRAGQYRVFYTVKEDQVLVIIIAIGVKEHNTLFIEGKKFKL